MGSTELQPNHYRALGSQVRTKMCSSRNNPGPGPGQQNNNTQEFQWQGGLYPDLSGLSFTDPFLMTFICIFAIHKTVIRKKPLLDLNYWKRRIAGMENSRMN